MLGVQFDKIKAKNGDSGYREMELMRIIGSHFPLKSLVVLSLLAVAPCRAQQDVVYPLGIVTKLSNEDKKSYARLDFPNGKRSLEIFPNKIMAAGKSSWQVPVPRLKFAGRTLYAPTGEYVLSLGPVPGSGQLYFGAGKYTLSGYECEITINTQIVFELGEITLPWKAETGATYEITTSVPVKAPTPMASLIRNCSFSVTPPPPGSGTVNICLKNIKGGSQQAPDCRDVHYYYVMPNNGASTQASNQGGSLITAASKGDLPRVKTLLAAGSDVNAKASDGSTALMMASFNGHLEVVRALLDAKADVNTKWGDHGTALIMASQNDHLDVVRTLLEGKADVNAKADNGVTALIIASQLGHLEVVRALLEANADMNVKRNDGVTALIMASQLGHLEVVRALLEANADVNAKTDKGGTALMAASYGGHLDVVRALLEAKAEVNTMAGNGGTALMAASYGGHLNVVRALLEAKADVNVRTGDGTTALIMAAKSGHQDIAQALRDAGAVGESNQTLTTPPTAAAENGSAATKAMASPQATNAEIVSVDDLFTLAGKPVEVWLTRQADGTWQFKPSQEPAGAVAQVDMKDGVFFDLVWKSATEWTVSTRGIKGQNLKLTAMMLPTGEKILGMSSKKLYAGRFRVVFDGLGTSSKKLPFFIDEQDKTLK